MRNLNRSIITIIVLVLISCSTDSGTEYNLQVTLNPSEAGTVSPSSGIFNDGEEVVIKATANDDWVFEKWQGDHSGSGNPLKITMDSDKELIANFVERKYELIIESEGKGKVNEKVIQQKSTEYPSGTTVELTAVPEDGWMFAEWKGDLEGNEITQQITISEEVTIKAVFVLPPDLPSELTPATIFVEYFNSQNVPNDEKYLVYQQVKSIAFSGNSLLSFGGNAALISNFLQLAPGLNIQPEADGGDFVWNFNFAEDFPQFGIDATISVIASQSGDRTNWQVIYDGELEEQVVEDFLFLDGFTANDQSTGEWYGYNPENPGSPAYTYAWDIEAENEYELKLDLFQEGQVAASVNYVKTGVENNLVYTRAGEPTLEVYWNEETDSGWLDEEGEERRCYTNFVNSACS